MYKLRKNSTRKNILKFASWLMTTLFFMSVSFAWEASFTPFNILNKRVDSAKKNLELNGAEWKAIVKDLYSNSLKQVELAKTSPMLNSVKTTTVALNNNYLCSIKDNDTINILYKSNDDFKKQLRNLSANFKKPIKSDMVDSCEKLMTCVLWTGGDKKVSDSLSYCKIIVNDYYLNEYKNNYNISSLSDGNKWSEAFWNNTLSDSSYDILNDIYILARILFDTPEEPTEVLFYNMPDIWSAENMLDPYLFAVNDWYSPYYHQEENPWWNDNPNPGWWNNGGGGSAWNQGTTTTTQTTEIVVEWELEEEIIEFTQTTTYEVEWKEWYEFLWNDCIDWFEIEWYDAFSYTETTTWIASWSSMTPTQYVEFIIEEINDLICEYDENCNQPSWTSWGSQWGPSQWTWSGNNSIPDIDEETESCFQSCNEIPCNEKSCDRLACYAKCLCISYESPFFDPLENPWLWPIFKLKFCIQPVQEHKIVTSQKVNNLESVVNTINIVIQDLRNSWELMLNKKTKELLDAGFQKNDFSKQISLSIDWYEKIPESKTSDKQEKENQTNLNTSLMESILWFDKEETADWNGRNKYVVRWGSVEIWAISSEQKNPSTYETISDSEDIIWSLKSSHINNMWSKVYDFLAWNLEFWQSFKEAIDSIKLTAKSLAEKK